MIIEIILRIIGALVLGYVCWQVGILADQSLTSLDLSRYLIGFGIAGGIVGFLVTPYLVLRPAEWLRQKTHQMSLQDIIAAVIGLVVGLIIGALLAWPLSFLPSFLGRLLPALGAVFFSYLGIIVMEAKGRELFELVGRPLTGGGQGKAGRKGDYVILDTSAIIDGRIADISQTGFISGTMLIPRFVLNELQHIADSPDVLRRNRGRRGLDMLNKLQKESKTPIQISEVDEPKVADVDSKLVQVAKTLHAPIITNDFNLNRIAGLQGVKVLNVNELANAVKSVVLPGEELTVRIIQEGKELGQGVSYLDDGTMIVVENGRRYIGSDLDVVVTRVLQTVAGRMIFAHPKASE